MSCTLTLPLTISTALHNSNRKERLPQKHLSADSSEQAIQEVIADPKMRSSVPPQRCSNLIGKF